MGCMGGKPISNGGESKMELSKAEMLHIREWALIVAQEFNHVSDPHNIIDRIEEELGCKGCKLYYCLDNCPHKA
jgi:hypothetical protein